MQDKHMITTRPRWRLRDFAHDTSLILADYRPLMQAYHRRDFSTSSVRRPAT